MRIQPLEARRASLGLAWLESAVLASTLALTLVALTIAVQRGMSRFRQSQDDRQVAQELDDAITQLWSRLAGADAAGLLSSLHSDVDPVGTWSGVLQFQAVSGWSQGNKTLSTPAGILLRHAEGELDNGRDDDGDGLVDECEVILLEDVGSSSPGEQRLMASVSEYLEGEVPNGLDDNHNGLVDERGLCIDERDGLVTLRISVETLDAAGRRILHSRTATLGLRNRDAHGVGTALSADDGGARAR